MENVLKKRYGPFKDVRSLRVNIGDVHDRWRRCE